MAAMPPVILLLVCLGYGYCFNIDVENFVVYDGPRKGDQFGFSSAMLENDNGKWLLVGAPMSNSSVRPDIPRTGGFFKCPVNFADGQRRQRCELDSEMPTINSNDAQRPYTFQQQNQLLGSNIILTDETPKRIVMCASKYKETSSESTTAVLYAKGRCNVGISDNLDAQVDPTQYRVDVKNVYRMGMIGFSFAKLSNVPLFDLVLGAPGANEGTGAFLFMNTLDVKDQRQFRDYQVADHTNLRTSFKRGSYLGYSIGAGQFGSSEKLTIVAGAPHYRKQGHFGIVQLLDISGEDYDIATSKEGPQPGCGYGAALVVMDINNDDRDDILVGAPFYTGKATDEGLVEVMYGTHDPSNILRRPQEYLRGSRAPNGRFGIAITDIGDINADNFKDVAIGAPFENEQRGALYIYNGHSTNVKFSQRIGAETLDSGLRGFGFHISAPYDIDDNTYNDVAVGAFMSDQTVILRSRPVVRLDRTVTINPKSVPLNPANLSCQQGADDHLPCLTFHVCFNFTARGVNQRINIVFEISADARRKANGKSGRLDLFMDGQRRGDEFEYNYQIWDNANNCKDIIGRVKSIGWDFFKAIREPVEIKLNYRLSKEPILGHVLPILDNIRNPNSTENVSFDTGCSGGLCQSDLQLKVSSTTSEIIMGETNDLSINVEIINQGEPAFTTRIVSTSSTNADYLSFKLSKGTEQILCKQNGTGSIEDVACDFSNPFFQTKMGAFFLKYGVSMATLLPSNGLVVDVKPVVSFNLTAVTTSKEIKPVDNIGMVEIPVRIKPNVVLYGTTTPEQATISPNNDKLISFVNTFNIYNSGPSPLPRTTVMLIFPKKSRENVFLLDHIKVLETSNTVSCRILDELTSPQSTTTNPNGGQPTRLRRAAEESESLPLQAKSIQNLTCDNHDCVHIECKLQQLNVGSEVSVAVAINITESALTFEKDSLLLSYVSEAEIHRPHHPLVTSSYWSKNSKGKASIAIYPAEERKVTDDINLWIIIAGSVGGLVLFLALGLLLWKCGFFKRQKRKEVQEWKRKSGYNARRSQRGSAVHRHAGSSVKSKTSGREDVGIMGD